MLVEEPLPVELPVELPLPIEPPVPGELVPGVPLGEVLVPELPLPVIDPEDVPPDAPLAPEPDLLKWASHSAREICPSLFLSTSEKLGVEALLDAPLAEDMPEEPVELLPEADGDDTDGDEVDGLDDDEDEDCATASVDSAKSTAAVVMLRVLGMD